MTLFGEPQGIRHLGKRSARWPDREQAPGTVHADLNNCWLRANRFPQLDRWTSLKEASARPVDKRSQKETGPPVVGSAHGRLTIRKGDRLGEIAA
jgi:hypothetical protein